MSARTARRLACFFSLILLLVFAVPPANSASAHPGGTDGDGCHTCRTNCTERWGIPYGYYHRHGPVRDCFASPDPNPVPLISPTTTTTTRPTATTTRPVPSRFGDLDLPPPRGLLAGRSGTATEAQSFMESVRNLQETIAEFAVEVHATSAAWDQRQSTFAETRTRLTSLRERADQLAADWSTEAIPPELAEAHAAFDDIAHLAPELMLEVVVGLDAPDDGQRRRDAVAVFERFSSDHTRYTALALSAIQGTARTTPTSVSPTTTIPAPDPTAVASSDVPSSGRGSPIPLLLLVAVGAYLIGRRSK